jgi:hypothetical protein
LTEANIAALGNLARKGKAAGGDEQHQTQSTNSIFSSPRIGHGGGGHQQQHALTAGSSAAEGTGGGGVSSSSRLAHQHRVVAEALNEGIVDVLKTKPVASRVVVSGAAETTATPHRSGGGGEDLARGNTMASPALRQLLERHQQRCTQLLV